MSDAPKLISDIRAAVGDPQGKLTHDELVEHCRNLSIGSIDARRERDEARAVAELLWKRFRGEGYFLNPVPWDLRK